jgi:hypothetical protein
MHTLPCPSCGAPLKFEVGLSFFATCEYCHTQSRRTDKGLEQLGVISEVMEDGSPLQLGATGQFEGSSFTLVGRLQYLYERGFWNEWYLAFADGTASWLGEAQGYYMMMQWSNESVSSQFSQLKPGKQLSLKLPQPSAFTVVDRKQARVVSGEGELPLPIREGYDAEVVDLNDSKGKCATIDFSESPPLVFVGRYCSFEELKWNGLRQIEGWLP